jgi:hypothetical protein
MSAYLVQYGRLAFVGRFTAPPACGFARDARVVIRGPRGLELGTVLCEAKSSGEPDGELLRTATGEDFAAAEHNEALGAMLLAEADAAELPIAFIDSEVSLDGRTAVLHGLPWAACDADPLLARLSDSFHLSVRMLDLSQARGPADPPDPEKATCGKPDCGSGAGCSSCGSGCSTGSCSRGAVKSAGELTAYFADLRRKMESEVRTPLV